jgi:hypothetical protein
MKISDQHPAGFGVKEQELVHSLLALPHKIIRHHNIPGLANLVLHELASDNLFHMKKAVYLADNPDFDHLIGVAGFSNDERHLYEGDLWGDVCKMAESMSGSSYNKSVQSYLRSSLRAKNIDFHNKAEIEQLGNDMGLVQPQFLAWDMKHGNHGLLLFEHDNPTSFDVLKHKMLANAVALLSLCPIF